jgi:hypothetical protein
MESWPEPPWLDDAPACCPLCGEVIDEDHPGVFRLVDLDPCNPEVGPQPDVGEHLVHDECPGPRP